MIRIGLIGGGRWGKNHFRVLSAARCKLSGLADIDVDKSKPAAEQGIPFETDFRKLLPRVDALVIATPSSTHFAIALECLQAGKHVLVEKPLALFSAQARELTEVASQAELVLAVGHLYRLNPAVIRLKDELKKIGQIRHIRMRYLNIDSASPVDCNVIFDLGSHLFDLLLFLTSRTPQKITCSKPDSTAFKRNGVTNITAHYGDSKACLEMSWAHSSKKRDAWFIGSKSSIYIDFLGQTLMKYSNGVPGSGIKLAVKNNEPLEAEVGHFIHCVEKGEKPVNSGEDACRVIGLCEAATRSMDAGCEIYL